MSPASSRPSAVAALLIVAACSAGETPPDTASTAARASDTAAGATLPSASGPALAQVTREQFAQLRWLEGTWRGSGASGTEQAPFYERYRVVDDTTMAMESFSDSTLTTRTGESRIVLTGGRVLNRETGGDRSSGAVKVDASSIDFVPVNRGFTYSWRRGATKDEWTAVIGAAGDRTYTMRRWAKR